MAVDLEQVKRLIKVHGDGVFNEGGGSSSDGWYAVGWYSEGIGLEICINQMIEELETCRREHTHTATNPPT